MRNSNAKKLWDGVQDLANLKIIDFCGSKKLKELSDFSMAYKLEIVRLSGCESLRRIHPSILSLHSIVTLNVSCCYELECLESETHLESLSMVDAFLCRMLKKLCLSSKKLREITLQGTDVEILHLPVGRCTELRELRLYCDRLSSLPIDELCYLTNLEVFQVFDFRQVIHTSELHSLFDAWRNLRTLRLDRCTYLSVIPDNIDGLTRLQYLSLDYSGMEILPGCISRLSSLKRINLRKCESLKSILGLPPFLEELYAGGCTLLETVYSDSLPRHPCDLHFGNCMKLDERSLRFINELTYSAMTSSYYEDYYVDVCYPGSRVPEWMEYRPMPQPSHAIQIIYNPKLSHGILFCCVAPHHLVSEGFNRVWCDLSIDGDKRYVAYAVSKDNDFGMDSDHVFLWRMNMGKNDAVTGNSAKVSCEFFLSYWDKEKDMDTKVPLEACGVHVIYFLESDLELEVGRKRKRDADEEGVTPTKKLKNNCSVSQPTPIGLELDQSE